MEACRPGAARRLGVRVPNESTSGAADLDGWQGSSCASITSPCSARDPRTLQQITSHLEATFGALIAQSSESLAG